MSKRIIFVIIFLCVIKLILHLIGDSNSGFQGDELLHIATGKHPSWGYMEFPPVIGWLAYVQNHLGSSSVFVHHIFSHLASILIFIVVALTVVALGGKAKAVFVALLCMLVAPAFGRGHQLFQPVVFTQLFWLLSFYQLVRFNKTLDEKYLWYLTLCLGFGFLTKYDILFFIAGILGLLFFKRIRKTLLTKSLWKFITLFLLMIVPNLFWQYTHDFPVMDMFSRLYETQLDKLTAFGVIQQLVISLNPITAIIWLGGLLYMFNGKDKILFRPLASCIVLSIFLLAVNKSKAYYFYPAIITLLIFGSIWFEEKVLNWRKWLLYPIVGLLALSGAVLIPFGLAILPLDSFIKFANLKEENGRVAVEYQEYYSQYKWKNTMDALQQVYDSLPSSEKKNALIWGKHYSQAGGVNLFRKDYNLPKAISYHGSFYLWVPSHGELPITIIGFSNGEAGIDFFQDFFNEVTAVKRVYNPYADFDKDLWQTIYICKRPKVNFAALKDEFTSRVFE